MPSLSELSHHLGQVTPIIDPRRSISIAANCMDHFDRALGRIM